MKRLALLGSLAIGLGLIASLGLSVLGHYRIWVFSASLNTNLFVVGIAFLVIAYFSLTSANEYHRRMPVFTSLTKLGKPVNDSSIYNLLFFFILALIFGALFALLPPIVI